MVMPNPGTSLSNIYKSLTDEGRFAAAVWASPDKVSLISLTMNTVVKETHSPHPPEGAPGPFSLYDENILKESFIRYGFKDIALERMNVAFEFDSAESYEIFTYETAGPLHSMLVNET